MGDAAVAQKFSAAGIVPNVIPSAPARKLTVSLALTALDRITDKGFLLS